MQVSVRIAHERDLDQAADTLADAFADYPWTRYVIPPQGYRDRLRSLQRLYLGHALTHGVVAITDTCAGVIAVLPPDAPDPAPPIIDQIIALHGDRIDRLSSADAPPQAWRLETLGVLPAHRGHGVASLLLQFALDGVGQRGGKHVALDTSDPRNVRLYERHGFVVTSHAQDAEAPPVWSMVHTLTATSVGTSQP